MTDELEIDKEKRVCVNCHFMQSLLGRNPKDTFPCSFCGKMIENVQNNSCPNWVKRELDILL
jgi:transcription initiation factor IIE alpha subunit